MSLQLPLSTPENRSLKHPRGRLLNQAELHLADFADHCLVPRWVPNEFNVSIADAGDAEHFLLGFGGDDGAHAAAGCGEGHFDGDARAFAFGLLDVAIVDKAEVDDVDGDFRIVTGLELIPDFLLIDANIRGDGAAFGLRGGRDAEGVAIAVSDAGETLIGGNGVAAAERLGDHHGRAGGEREGIAARDADCLAVAREDGFGRGILHGWKGGA